MVLKKNYIYKLNKKYFKYRIKWLSYKPVIKASIPTNMNQQTSWLPYTKFARH